jgi:hypothetical protein
MCFKADKRGVSVQAGHIQQLSEPPGLGRREFWSILSQGSKRKEEREGGEMGLKKKGDHEKGQK